MPKEAVSLIAVVDANIIEKPVFKLRRILTGSMTPTDLPTAQSVLLRIHSILMVVLITVRDSKLFPRCNLTNLL